MEALAQHLTHALGLTPRPGWMEGLAAGVGSVAERTGWSLDEVVRRAQCDPALLNDVAAHVTVGETHFMRCPAQLREVARFAMERLVGGRPGPLRVWSAGCATGEEVYSILIALDQDCPLALATGADVLGTDLDPTAVDVARSARYRAWSFRGVAPQVLAHSTEADGDARRVIARLRQGTRFECESIQGALARFPAASFDVILFRNVAIYLSAVELEKLWQGFRRVLKADGMLIVAPSDPAPARHLFLRSNAEAAGVYAPASDDRSSRPSPPPTLTRPSLPAKPAATPKRRAAVSVPLRVRPEPSPSEAPVPSRTASEARALADRGEVEAGLARIEAWIRDAPAADAYLLRAQLLLASGRVSEAVEAMRTSVYLDAEDPLARFWYASALHLAGKESRARQQLSVALSALARLPAEARMSDGETSCADLIEAARFLEETLS